MFCKIFVAALAFVGFCSGAPLETTASLEPRVHVTKPGIENVFLDVQLGYQAVADHVVFLGPGVPKAVGNLTITFYRDLVEGLTPIPAKTGTDYPEAIQYNFCNAETTYVIQLLETHSLLRQYAKQFTKHQRKEVIAIAKEEKKKTKPFSAIFATYVPLCKKSILHNGDISLETIKDTILVFEGKTPGITPPPPA